MYLVIVLDVLEYRVRLQPDGPCPGKRRARCELETGEAKGHELAQVPRGPGPPDGMFAARVPFGVNEGRREEEVNEVQEPAIECLLVLALRRRQVRLFALGPSRAARGRGREFVGLRLGLRNCPFTCIASVHAAHGFEDASGFSLLLPSSFSGRLSRQVLFAPERAVGHSTTASHRRILPLRWRCFRGRLLLLVVVAESFEGPFR